MKIMIVDDEALSRVGIRNIIPWEEHGYSVVGEAANGKQAIEMAKKYKPDIIMVDIIMPEMNGLDFIKEVREVLPSSKFIILSCMNDAEYYRKAILLGVNDYILKSSISIGEILKAIERISAEIVKERVFEENSNGDREYINQNVVLTEFLNIVLKGNIADSNIINKKLLSHGICMNNGMMFTGVMALSNSEGNESEYDRFLDYSLMDLTLGIINDIGKGFIFKNFEDRVTFIVSFDDVRTDMQAMKDLCLRIIKTINQYIDMDATIGIGRQMDGLGSISKHYMEATKALSQSFIHGRGNAYFFHVQSEKDMEAIKEISKIVREVIDIKNISYIDSIIEKVDTITDVLTRSEALTSESAIAAFLEILYHLINILYVEDIDIKNIMGEDFIPVEYIKKPRDLKQLRECMLQILIQTKEYYFRKIESAGSKVVAQVNQYVREHIAERIQLKDIAEEVHFSINYISRLYKMETGENLQNYILGIKIEQSKKLLSNGCCLQQVSDNLAFSSVSHFIRAFRNHTGLTPGQYIKKFVYK